MGSSHVVGSFVCVFKRDSRVCVFLCLARFLNPSKTYQLLLLLNDKDLNVVIVVKHVLLKEVWKKPLILELDLNFSDLWPLQV